MVVGLHREKLMFSIAWDWLHRGWRDFRQATLLNMGYAAIFLIIGLGIAFGLHGRGYSLIYFIVAGGFLLVVPGLVTAYYCMAETLHSGQRPQLNDMLNGIRRCPVTIFVIGLVSLVIYLIWITDSLIIYNVYFDFSSPALAQFQLDPALHEDLQAFLVFVSIMGAALSFIIFCVTVLSIPYALERRAGLVDSVSFSVKAVSRYTRVMIFWALILGALTFITVLFALPLLLVVLPVLAYANFATYNDMLKLMEQG